MSISISIIIPVYNASKYLRECLESVLAQTFSDFEIICINDGSTDGSLDILKDFEQRDTRIRLIDQKNQGVSAARNVGLEIATGKYVGFIDADDWIEKEYFKELFADIEASTRKELSMCGFVGSYPVSLKKTRKSLKDFDYREMVEILDSYLFFMPFSKLFNREIINRERIRFPIDINFGEDLIFNFKYLKHISEISISDKILYNYNFKNISSLSKSFSFLKFRSNENKIEIIRDFLFALDGKSTIYNHYISKLNYWNAYDALHYLLNNFNKFEKENMMFHIKCLLDFKYFVNMQKLSGASNILVKIAQLRNDNLVYNYMKLRSCLSSLNILRK